jgi:rhamnosyltransferase
LYAPRDNQLMGTSMGTIAEPRLLFAGQVHSLSSRNDGRLISVLIPVKNGADQLREVLPRILSQQSEHRVEIIGVDSGSTDETVEVLRHFSAAVVSIDPRSFNSGQTRTLATRYARGHIFVFITHRTLPANPHWLANLVAPLANDGRVAGVYSRILPRPDADLLTLKDHLCWSPANDTRAITNWAEYQALSPRERRLFIWFSTVSAAIRPEVFAQIPFREVKYNEDMLWAREVIEAGYKIEYERSSIVLHSHNYTDAELLCRYFDDGVANREFVGLRLSANEILTQIRRDVYDDWRFLKQRHRADAVELQDWEIASVLRRTAQCIGFWIGTNSDRLPGDVEGLLAYCESDEFPMELQSLVAEVRQSFTHGQSERTQGRGRLTYDEALAVIKLRMLQDWRSLPVDRPPGSSDREQVRLQAALRRVAQAVGLWLGSNSEGLPDDLASWLSLVNRLRAGAATEGGQARLNSPSNAPKSHNPSRLQSGSATSESQPQPHRPEFDAPQMGYVDALATALDLSSSRITDLQTALYTRVAECNRAIEELQTELHSKVGDRDQTIRALQSELHAKVAECNRIIQVLQSQLDNRHSSPGSRNGLVGGGVNRVRAAYSDCLRRSLRLERRVVQTLRRFRRRQPD